jgi:hypothetical protein
MPNYVHVYGYWAVAHSEDEEISHYEMLHAYQMDDGFYYIFFGSYENNSEDSTRPGLYQKVTDDFTYISYPEGEEVGQERVVEKESLSRMEDLINKSLVPVLSGKGPLTPPKPTHQHTRVIIPGDEKTMKFDINEADNDMVKLIKEAVNDKCITFGDYYVHFDSRNTGYNMFYGLQTRHRISWNYVLKWAEVLDLEVDVRLVPKKRKRVE